MTSIDQISKNEILQEMASFIDPKVSPHKARILLAQLLCLVNRGSQQLTEDEGTTVFFNITRIFQHESLSLKKMIYLEMVKEPSFYIITSSLLRDMKDKSDFIRMNALKILPYIIEQNNPVQSEQLIKAATLDKSISVVNSALLASFRISLKHSEHVRKCANDIQNVLTNHPGTCHYHALNVLYNIKKNDMMSFIKILLQLTKSSKSFNILTNIQMIRYVREVIESNLIDPATEKELFLWLAKQLNKSNTVVIEVARTMVSMKNITNSELSAVVASLGLYLLSLTSINVFAALKIIKKNPTRASLINYVSDIEPLLSHDNNNIKELAVGILLKICKKDKVKQLLEKILVMFEKLPDAFMIEIIGHCRDLSAKFPEISVEILSFLWKCLREKGELEFKYQVIDTMDAIVQTCKNHHSIVFEFYCEYIEDPYSSELILKIFEKLRNLVDKVENPNRYLRFILNRMHLDGTAIRAASITCMGELALKIPSMRDEVKSIVVSFLHDVDEEVRDRAYYYNKVLSGDKDFVELNSYNCFNVSDLESIQHLLEERLDKIEELGIDALLEIPKNLGKTSSQKINAMTSKIAQEFVSPVTSPSVHHVVDISSNMNNSSDLFDAELADFFAEHEEISQYGALRLSGEYLNLSDKDSEYFTTIRKHIFDNFIVLEYTVQNNDDEHDLKEVSVEVELECEDDLQVSNIVENQLIQRGESGKIFVSLAKNPETPAATTKISSTLKFTANNPETDNSYQDDYNLEEYLIKISDYLVPFQVPKGQFNTLFSSSDYTEEAKTQTFKLNYKTVENAIENLVQHFGVASCDNSDKIGALNNFHTLYLAGKWLGWRGLLIGCQIGIDKQHGCVVKMSLKLEDAEPEEDEVDNTDEILNSIVASLQ